MSASFVLQAAFASLTMSFVESDRLFDPVVNDATPVALVQNLAAPDLGGGNMVVFDPAPDPSGELVDHELHRAADGLFYVNARVNGAKIRFLVDTGASVVVLTKADATRAGVTTTAEDFSAPAQTAGGNASMARITLAHVEVGAVSNKAIAAAVASDGLNISLLGQSWLSRLQSMSVEGDRMILR